MLDQQTIERLTDRYEGEVDEFLETLQITLTDLIKAFPSRINRYRKDLDI